MAAHINNIKYPMPPINGVKHNCWINGRKIWADDAGANEVVIIHNGNMPAAYTLTNIPVAVMPFDVFMGFWNNLAKVEWTIEITSSTRGLMKTTGVGAAPHPTNDLTFTIANWGMGFNWTDFQLAWFTSLQQSRWQAGWGTGFGTMSDLRVTLKV